jgi:isorenieratene synthase
VRTDVPGLTLAGDWVATPFPSALMERAAATGIGAANVILAAHRYRTEPVWSVPPRGILAGRWAASMRRPDQRWTALRESGQREPDQRGPAQPARTP